MKNLLSLFMCVVIHYTSTGQTIPAREVNQQVQTWFSINSVYRFSEKWGMIGDMHVRRNNGFTDPSFYFVRVGANYWIKDNMSVGAGYGHMWQAPQQKNLKLWARENRLHEQFVFTGSLGATQIVQRVRNEQRWQQLVINDTYTGKVRFSNRFRYLISFNFPIFSNPRLPSLIVADEILIHFGEAVVYNTFDQNRLFIGIKQPISKRVNFDFGYMNVYQQKYSGYQYDMNHTIRLFFYYNGGWKREKKQVSEQHDE